MHEERLHVEFLIKSPESRNQRIKDHPDGQTADQTNWIFSFQWEKNDHPVGAYIEYADGVSHKEAFDVLVPHLWEAMQRPDDYNVRWDRDVQPIAVLGGE